MHPSSIAETLKTTGCANICSDLNYLPETFLDFGQVIIFSWWPAARLDPQATTVTRLQSSD
jgi:hypothetical protein